MPTSRTLAVAVVGVLAVGAFAACPFADAAAPESPHGTSVTMARANTTVVTEVQNAMDYPAWLHIGENDTWFGPVDAHSTKTGAITIPWVGNSGEMGKSIQVYKEGTTCSPCRPYKFLLYQIFQDYWQPSDQIKYTKTGIYDYAVPVSGSSTGGGNKRLIIAPDKPYM